MANDIIQSENKLYEDAISIIDSGRKRVIESVYNETTNSYYALGKLIVEIEQNGKLKATYGKKVVENLSKKLTLKYGKGFSSSTLWDCQKFYKKLQSLSGVLDCQKIQSMTGELKFRLSFTHYTYLMRLDDEEMKFYENYAIEQKLSVRELQKAVQNNTILRLEEKKQDLGQLQMYVNYFDREIKDENDNETIGILLCNDKNEKVVEYTLPKDNNQIFASKYKLYLPTKEELVEELSNE